MNLPFLSAGLIVMGQITGEIIIRNQKIPVPSVIEICYFVQGLFVLILGFNDHRKVSS